MARGRNEETRVKWNLVSRKQSKRKLIGKYLKALAAMNPKEKKTKKHKIGCTTQISNT